MTNIEKIDEQLKKNKEKTKNLYAEKNAIEKRHRHAQKKKREHYAIKVGIALAQNPKNKEVIIQILNKCKSETEDVEKIYNYLMELKN